MRSSIICEAEFAVRELSFRGSVVRSVGLRVDDLATALRGVAAFATTRLVALFLVTFADFVDLLPGIVFSPKKGFRVIALADCGDVRGFLPSLRDPAGQGGRLPDPRRHLSLV
jgi:hypothetical protein